MSRATKPGTPDAGPPPDPKPGHAPVGVSGYALDPPPPPPPPDPPPQLVLGDGPTLWEGCIPKDKSARRLVFLGPEHAMEAAVKYLQCLGCTSTIHRVEVRKLDAVPRGWAMPESPIPPPTVMPEDPAFPTPPWARR